MNVDPVSLGVFKNLFASLTEEMGAVLRKSAFSPNIKERRDYSCALFDENGDTVAQGEHMPVHLGSLPLSVKMSLETLDIKENDVAVLNDPFRGGTHLPDITMITAVPVGTGMCYLAGRAHHSDVGGMRAGSMPLSTEIYQEGLVIPPVKLVEGGTERKDVMDIILANVRTPEERRGDLSAQLASLRRGRIRLESINAVYGADECLFYMGALQDYSEKALRTYLRDIPDGTYEFEDYMDDDGRGEKSVRICVSIRIHGGRAEVDFSGTDEQQTGCINAVLSITLSAVAYVFRCLLPWDIPSNSGYLRAIDLNVPEGSLLNARPPAAVAAGNVETSQRVVDVMLGALSRAVPDRIPAASGGTMNNIALGGGDNGRGEPFTYYETIGVGSGAGPGGPGASAVHVHMTNSLNTPVEALESDYPLIIDEYSVRRGSGEAGLYPGGDGIIRKYRFLADTSVSLLTDRRRTTPYGLQGGGNGRKGGNVLFRNKKRTVLPSKTVVNVGNGDALAIETPGGGGWGSDDR